VLTQTIPFDLADAICGSEIAAEAAALLLAFVGAVFAGAIEFEGAAIEFAGAVEFAVAA